MTFTIRFPKVIDPELAELVQEQAVYAAPELRRLRVAADRASAEVEHEGGRDEAELRPVVERYVDDFVRRVRRASGEVWYRRERSGPLTRDTFGELVRRGWAFPLGEGQVGLSGPAMALARGLDRAFARLAKARFDAEEQVYPTLIPTDVLKRCGYFSSFPHLVSMVSHFVGDYEALEQVRDANGEGTAAELVLPDRAAVAPPAACVTPATCYHCYQALQAKALQAPGRAFTAVGRCARYESSNMTGLDRLWEFTMREIVFVGQPEWVASQRARAMEGVRELLERWEVACSIESATDPFFAPLYATKTFWQAQGQLKYEMRLTVEPHEDGAPRTISAGSFNLHEDFFGRTFGIEVEGTAAVAVTGCTAFGIERWVLAIFAQHGMDPDGWPEGLRGVMEDGEG